jgi:membrane protein implicated in regulation of membrane protease activity
MWAEYDGNTSTLGFVSVAIAIVLLLAEAHLSTGGIIAVGASVALVGGVALLAAGSGASAIAVVVAAGAVCGVSIGGVLLLRSTLGSVRHLGPRSGTDAMVGHVGVVRVGDSTARVYVDGGLWRAQPSALEEGRALHDGDRVVVERVNGLTLCVRRAEEWELNP